jgi:hypothetical protein
MPSLGKRSIATYSFTLQVAGVDTARSGYEDAFYGANCDDALITAIDGTLFLDFDREAPSYGRAVESAIDDVEQAGGRVVKVDRIFE